MEEIQDIVEEELMNAGAYELARVYVRYRYDREKARTKNTIDDKIMTLIEGSNEDIKQENSNKNSTILPTQRDYMAGEVSKDLCHRVFLPKDVVKAHDEGIIHFHDTDYFAQHMYNCCLVNLEDMFQNFINNHKTAIDHIHTNLPSAKVVVSIEPYGCINTSRDWDGKKYSVLNAVRSMLIMLEGTDYESFTRLAPSYACVDLVYGYSDSQVAPSSRYPNITEISAGDGVHPSSKGMRQIADCIYPIITKMLL